MLSKRIAALESPDNADEGVVKHLRVMERYVARAEEKLLRFERDNSSWRRPTLRLEMNEES